MCCCLLVLLRRESWLVVTARSGSPALLPTLLFLALHLLYKEVLVQELGEDLLRELAPKLSHEVPCCQILRRLQVLIDLSQGCNAEHIVVNDTNLQQENRKFRRK